VNADAPTHPDPIALARWQDAYDRAATRGAPGLLARKQERMARSPHAFLRGSAPMFYQLLATRPQLAPGPDDGGWIVGDLHVENFGAWRVDGRDRRRGGRVVFDVNDFDLAACGPWRLDLARLVTSVLLAAGDRAVDGRQAVQLARALLDGWRDAAFGDGPAPAAPPSIAGLVAAVAARTREGMLATRTVAVDGERRFVRGPRYADLSAGRAAECARAFARYATSLPEPRRPTPEEAEVEDLAFRVAGTGSLGVLRVAVLTRGHGPPDGGWIFDMKETRPLPEGSLLRAPPGDPAERVVQACLACLEHAPRMLGTTRVGARSMLVRRLAPQEDKLDFDGLDAAGFESVARHLGALAGSAHRRGAARRPARAWRGRDLEAIVQGAVALAGLHVSAWLAWCALR
jgi:uncharacterized protein (DUF2252 family)